MQRWRTPRSKTNAVLTAPVRIILTVFAKVIVSVFFRQLIKSYIKNNLSKKITLSDLSWKLHYSTVTLTEHFKKEYDITIMEYVMKKRMEKASRLLINSELSIREISEECGFCDNEYFSRCFKNYYGTSPVAWRKKLKEDDQ